jgi:hypothetical protein
MNMAEKQEASVAKTLGALAYESVFIYETDNETWTRVQITNEFFTRGVIAALFGPEFTVVQDARDDRGLLIRNNKLLKSSKQDDFAALMGAFGGGRK